MSNSFWLILHSENSIAIDPLNPGTLYEAGSSRLFKTPDGGEHWISLSLPYSGSSISRIFPDPVHSGTVYLYDRAFLSTLTDGTQGMQQSGNDINAF